MVVYILDLSCFHGRKLESSQSSHFQNMEVHLQCSENGFFLRCLLDDMPPFSSPLRFLREKHSTLLLANMVSQIG